MKGGSGRRPEFFGEGVKISEKALAGGPVFPIPVDGLAARLGAAAYLAWLAYPGAGEAARRRAFVEAWRALMIKAALAQGYERGRVKRGEHARQILGLTLKEINRRLRRGIKRIARVRLRAATAARLVMVGLPVTHAVKTKVTRNGSVRFDSKESASNAFARVWRPSLPAIHLALALRSVCMERGRRFEPNELVRRPDWLPAAIEESERLRVLLLAHPNFGAVNFIRLRGA